MIAYTGLEPIDHLLDVAKPSKTNEGNELRDISLNGDRYMFDFSLDKTWEQFDTGSDAAYFGIWTNKVLLRILTYAEGDISLVQCPDADRFDAKLAKMCEVYEPAPSMIAYSDKTRTVYYQDRSELFIDPKNCPPSPIEFTKDESKDSEP